MLLSLFYLSFSSSLVLSHPAEPLLVPELQNWREDRYIDCIFCIDYDNWRRISISGCSTQNPVKCKGNTCYMRQHKNKEFFLYTSGCLNLTRREFDEIAMEERDADIRKRDIEKKGDETLLCEVGRATNTCLCSNRKCNNMTLPAPFSEYNTSDLFGRINFRELLQFRYFIPEEPVLWNSDTKQLDSILRMSIADYRNSADQAVSITCFIISVIFLLFC